MPLFDDRLASVTELILFKFGGACKYAVNTARFTKRLVYSLRMASLSGATGWVIERERRQTVDLHM